MTTNHHTKAAILKTFNFFDLSSCKLGDRKAILELGSDECGIDASTKEQRKALTIHANLVKNTHKLNNTRRPKRKHRSSRETSLDERHTKVYELVDQREGSTIEA